MKKFNFRLQKLLDLKIDNEEKCKLEFKKALDKKKNINDKLNKFTSDYSKYNNLSIEGSTIEKKIRQNYLNVLSHSISQTSKQLKSQSEFVEYRRKELTEKQIERKTVEILKEKKFDEFKHQESLIEQKNNDEFALYGFIRNLERR